MHLMLWQSPTYSYEGNFKHYRTVALERKSFQLSCSHSQFFYAFRARSHGEADLQDKKYQNESIYFYMVLLF